MTSAASDTAAMDSTYIDAESDTDACEPSQCGDC